MNGIGLVDLARFSCNPNDLYALVGFELCHQFTFLRWRGHSIRISLSFPSPRLIKVSSVRLNSITIFSSHIEKINKAGSKLTLFLRTLILIRQYKTWANLPWKHRFPDRKRQATHEQTLIGTKFYLLGSSLVDAVWGKVQARDQTPTNGLRHPSSAHSSEDQKCWEAWGTICEHKAKDITPLIAWRREVLKEEALGNLPWKDERGSSSIRRTLESFHRQRCGNFWEIEQSSSGLSRAHRYHFELKWTELPPTTAIIGYTMGLRKPSANRQFFGCCSNGTKFVKDKLHQAFFACVFLIPPTLLSAAQIKPDSFESRWN